jgi:CBS domain-containing protein
MDRKRVKDLMIPLEECPVVDSRATLSEALLALDEAQKRLPSGRQPYRAVLVKDEDGRIVGKLGQWAFLMALEPKYAVHKDLGRLARAGVDPELVSAMMHHYQFFQDSLRDLCRRASTMTVREVMRPVEDNIDEDAPLNQAIHKLVLSQTLSVLVTRGAEVVGLIRLSDLFDEVAVEMKRPDIA